MSRRKPLAVRKPSGQIRAESQVPPPVAVRRARDPALAGALAPEWASMLGWLYLRSKITSEQYAAGKRWSELVAEYSCACQSPRAPRSANLDPAGGTPLDPDSAAGRREARRQARTAQCYITASLFLQRTGKAADRAVRDVCERGLAPAGIGEIEALRAGLQVLAAFWSGEAKAKAKS